jgi:cell division protein FtsB
VTSRFLDPFEPHVLTDAEKAMIIEHWHSRGRTYDRDMILDEDMPRLIGHGYAVEERLRQLAPLQAELENLRAELRRLQQQIEAGQTQLASMETANAGLRARVRSLEGLVLDFIDRGKHELAAGVSRAVS